MPTNVGGLLRPDRFEPGTIAKCRQGYLGIISRVFTNSATGEKLYKGFHMQPDKLGEPWESKAPTYVTHVNALMKLDSLKSILAKKL